MCIYRYLNMNKLFKHALTFYHECPPYFCGRAYLAYFD